MSVEDISRKNAGAGIIGGGGNRQFAPKELRPIEIDVEHFRKPLGVLQILQFVLTVLLLDLHKPPVLLFFGHMSILLVSIWIAIYALKYHKKYSIANASWILLEIISSGSLAAIALIASLVVTITASANSNTSLYLAGGICGLIIGFICLSQALIIAIEMRESKLNAQKGDPDSRF